MFSNGKDDEGEKTKNKTEKSPSISILSERAFLAQCFRGLFGLKRNCSLDFVFHLFFGFFSLHSEGDAAKYSIYLLMYSNNTTTKLDWLKDFDIFFCSFVPFSYGWMFEYWSVKNTTLNIKSIPCWNVRFLCSMEFYHLFHSIIHDFMP